jgi:anti-sigma factor RsiW
VIGRAHHLQEERLFDSYLAERGGQPIDPPVAEHLADCGACGSRYAELSAFMDGLRRDGEAEADAIFTPERLRAQQQQIARRIASVGRAARVLSFPGRLVQRTMDASASRNA